MYIRGPLPFVNGKVSHSQSFVNMQSFCLHLKLPSHIHLLISIQLTKHAVWYFAAHRHSLSLQNHPCWLVSYLKSSVYINIRKPELSTQGGRRAPCTISLKLLLDSKVDQSRIHLFKKLLSQALSINVCRVWSKSHVLFPEGGSFTSKVNMILPLYHDYNGEHLDIIVSYK